MRSMQNVWAQKSRVTIGCGVRFEKGVLSTFPESSASAYIGQRRGWVFFVIGRRSFMFIYLLLLAVAINCVPRRGEHL